VPLTDPAGHVAVVTGGASGIGLAMARRFVAEGMRVVVADVEQDALDAAAASVGFVGVRCDVRDLESVRSVAALTLARFGRVDVVCNNAGVTVESRIQDLTHEDWRWVIDVNLWGVIHGVEVFLPLLLDNPEGGHLVNTASGAGVTVRTGMGAYTVSKTAIVALSEVLRLELEETGAPVRVSVLCPSLLATRFLDSARNRPPELARPVPLSAYANALHDEFEVKALGARSTPDQIADIVWRALGTPAFWLFTEAAMVERAHGRIRGIRADVPLDDEET
jgi:NAD(P)-dependent dehydrogenase (short-subunit alcohol dehydrogenase family)